MRWRPSRTQDAVERFRAWLARNGRRAAVAALAAIGLALVLKGVGGLIV